MRDLVKTLLEVALEQSRAHKADLVVIREGSFQVLAEAVARERGGPQVVHSPSGDPAILVPVTVLDRARTTKTPVVLDDPAGAPGYRSDPYLARLRPRSVLCLPLTRHDEVLGVVYLENGKTAGAFSREQVTGLRLVTVQAGLALENALLLAREREAREAAEAAERRARFIEQAGAVVTESLDYDETLARLVRFCSTDFAENCLLDVVEGRIIRRLVSASTDPVREAALDRLARCHPARWDSPHPASICLRTRKPLLIQEMDDEFLREHTESEEHFELVRTIGARSAIVVPVIARGQTLGAMTLGSSTPRRFSRDDCELAQDIARRAAVAIDNARLHRAVQDADRRKAEFLAMLSHELRNPLAPIVMSIHVLERAPDGPLAERCRATIRRQAAHLTRLVDDLLDLNRISTGKFAIQPARTNVGEAVRRACDDLASEFEKRGVGLDLDLPAEAVWIEVDPTRLAQVVTNLVENAAKFTPMAGRVYVSVAGTGGGVEIRVRDTGVGIEPDQLERVFEPFAQADQGLARTQGGLGLGLALARMIVELHGGTVRAASEGAGRGAEFVATLPARPGGGAGAGIAATRASPGTSISTPSRSGG